MQCLSEVACRPAHLMCFFEFIFSWHHFVKDISNTYIEAKLIRKHKHNHKHKHKYSPHRPPLHHLYSPQGFPSPWIEADYKTATIQTLYLSRYFQVISVDHDRDSKSFERQYSYLYPIRLPPPPPSRWWCPPSPSDLKTAKHIDLENIIMIYSKIIWWSWASIVKVIYDDHDRYLKWYDDHDHR